ncbi:MAG: ABC transporter permease [candidate division Zixibacteria bacterium]|nr:ABC transporter permease [candidate division Zixibacteria bacterium]MDH3936226.1 ABC transporter permease [candidate division Zixibacteria bacterium]MDH4032744.1 ABC transporter permease [candidate division Zixibacteria bacterium]
MKALKLIGKNAFRRKLRTFLTILGLALAVMAFGLIRTFINAWYAGARAAAPDRLITRHAVSIIFQLPIAYREQLLKIEGVEDVTYATWFGGYYVDPSNFFANFAVDHSNYFDIYPEIVISADQLENFNKERNAAIVGQGLADRFGWRIGDKVPLIGTIYPGDWEFIIRGIYTGKEESTDETLFIFRFDCLDERMKTESPGRAGQTGWYGLKISDPGQAAAISNTVDERFNNSWAETRTETEKEFQMSFIQMSSAIILGLRIVSYLIIGIILMVLANTMAMTARERVSENAFMRTIGFQGYHLIGLILGESLFIAVLGGLVGMGLLVLVANGVSVALSQFFPGFQPDSLTFMFSFGTAVIVGLLAALFPISRALRIKIVDGLRVVD